MNKKTKTFSDIIHTNKKALSDFYYRYIFLIIILSTVTCSIVLYKMDAHKLMFGDDPAALGEYVKTVATVLGGALLILGLWINNRRVAEQIRQNNINEKGQLNTRFKDAATLLGSESVSSILSGIYALHQIAMESSTGDERQRGYVSIVHDILCAYIRENTDTINNEENGKAWRINKKPTIVIQTIVKVLFKNNGFIYRDLVADLSDCVFEHIDLDNAYLAGVDFSRTKFIKSHMKNAKVASCYFEEAFIDEVNFEGSNFCKCVFDYSHIRHSSFATTQIERCDFWGTHLADVKYNSAIFRMVDFKDAIIESDVSFTNTILSPYSHEEIKKKANQITKN